MKSNLAIIESQSIYSVPETEKLGTFKVNPEIFQKKIGEHTLSEAISHQAEVYKGMMKAAKNQLKKLKEIGDLLIQIRAFIGKSDKEFGQFIAKTDLAIMSRQDRSDAMWLAENWQDIQAFMKDMNVVSASAAYLRQKMRKSAKAESTESTPSAKAESSVEDSTVSSDSAESTIGTLNVDNEQVFAESVIQIAMSQNLDLAKIITAMLNAAKA